MGSNSTFYQILLCALCVSVVNLTLRTIPPSPCNFLQMTVMIAGNPERCEQGEVVAAVHQERRCHRVRARAGQGKDHANHKDAEDGTPGITKLRSMDGRERGCRYQYRDGQSEGPPR